MKFKHYIKRVEKTREFKKFKKEHKDSYLCAGFFVLDLEHGKNMEQLDYYLGNGKIATAMLDKGVKIKISEQPIKKKLFSLDKEVRTDLEAIPGIVHDEMINRSITEEIKKIIAIVYLSEGKVVWNLQCILNGLILLHVNVDDSNQSILMFEKFSLMDLIRK